MTLGMTLLVAALSALGALWGFQAWIRWRSGAVRGKPAPALPDGIGPSALLFFHSPTCAPCRLMHPTIDRLAEHDSRVHAVDITKSFDLARAFGVMATPTVVSVHAGVIADTRMGVQSPDALGEMLSAL